MLKYLFIISLIILIISCADKTRFSNDFGDYQSDLSVNTRFDEIDPIVNGEYLYFTAVYNINDKVNSEILKSKIQNGKTTNIIVVDNFYGDLLPTSTPSIFKNINTGLTEYYFSAKKCQKCDSDLYYTFALDDNFAPPAPIDIELNSEYEELQPRISNDGKKLLFTSSREDSYGETDIYFTEKDNNGLWKKPINLGNNYNTSSKEEYPTFGPNNEIYYASNGLSKKGEYNIYKADLIKVNKQIGKPVKLPSRINSKFDEKSYTIGNEGEVFYSSNRFGNYDIFVESRCFDAGVTFNFINKNNVNLNGVLTIKNDLNEIIINENITKNYIDFELAQDNKYLIEYTNLCYPQFNFEKEIYIPCNELKNMEYKFDIVVPEIPKSLDIEEYNIPFFVTGYYYPNTIVNLNNLKLLFKHNRFGADSTNYIENPSGKYETYAIEIEAAFENINEFLNKKIEEYNSVCDLNDEYIKITIFGYADERRIANGMRYFGPSIIDNSIGLDIKNGAQFDNLQLSKLRAYFTAQEIQTRIEQNSKYKSISSRIIWEVKGKGELIKNNRNMDLARRVSVLIETHKKENSQTKNNTK
jgi:hypothetical protein